MRMKGKVALVTGGTSGIGRRIVERFVEEGATVFFSGRRAALGAEVAKATKATFIEADVAREADAERSIKRSLEHNGRLDVLVNNAGGPAPGWKPCRCRASTTRSRSTCAARSPTSSTRAR